MARATQRAIEAAATAATEEAAITISDQDAHNLLVLLDRVPVTGVQEATLMALLATKLRNIRGQYTPAETKNG